MAANGSSMYFTGLESPPFLSIHDSADTCAMPCSTFTATTLPVRSRAVLSGDAFGTSITVVGFFVVYVDPDAAIFNGSPFSCAAASESTLMPPTSSEPDTTAAAIAFPFVKDWMSSVIPAFDRKPSLCAANISELESIGTLPTRSVTVSAARTICTPANGETATAPSPARTVRLSIPAQYATHPRGPWLCGGEFSHGGGVEVGGLGVVEDDRGGRLFGDDLERLRQFRTDGVRSVGQAPTR